MDWNTLLGYVGQRAAYQARIGEFWSAPFEHIERPVGASWTPIDELQDEQVIAADDSLLEVISVRPVEDAVEAALDGGGYWSRRRAAERRARRDEFFGRLQASRDLKTWVIGALKKAQTMAQVYQVASLVAEFDRSTPSWMRDPHACERWGLRPLGDLFSHVERAFTAAERRVRS